MKRKDFLKEWRGKDVSEQLAEIGKIERSLLRSRFKAGLGMPGDVISARTERKKIARLRTLMAGK